MIQQNKKVKLISMEEEHEFKQHICKFCSKIFTCGRSLGGHMRSHMIDDILAQADGTKLTKKKLPSLINYGINIAKIIKNEISGYGLRENPKKTWRIGADHHHSSEDASLIDKSCKECGRLFQSWKALFGHMKCHSIVKEKEKGQQNCWISADNQKRIMDSQSDNETSTPNRRRRSKRRTRYLGGTANSSSLYFANNDIDNSNNASSSVSEIDQQEQEEVAMCLMMLSRDVGGLNSVAESSDNNSEFLENHQVSSEPEGKKNSAETMKLKAFGDKKSEVGKVEDDVSKVESRKSELSVSGISRKGFTKNDKVNKCKRKFFNSFDPELKSYHFQNPDKASRFVCTTCNKVFNSYQALGGHRASHKRTKACSGSRIDSSVNSIETDLSPDPTVDSKLIINSIKNEISDSDNKPETSSGAKKSKRHECPICLKVFSSGQALGGHKRSHLVTGSDQDQAKNDQSSSIQESVPPPIRGFLDLNLPAPVEGQSNGLVPWWISSSQNHEHLVGLISN